MAFCKHRIMDKCLKDNRPCIFSDECFEPEEIKFQTNADRIRSMSDEKLADFLSSIAFEGDVLWADQFIEKLCKSCPTITCTVYGDHCQVELKECDFVDGKCPHGSEVMWWLQQPAEEANNG